MNYRFLELLASKAINADQTVTIDLDMTDPISEIIIDSRVTHGAEGAATAHWLASITKVEIIDGSDVLFSADGYEMEALDIYNGNMFPRSVWCHYFGLQESDRKTSISFGRYLWDELLALDPTKFGSPQLRITFAYQAGGVNPAACAVSVTAALFDQKVISPTGFLMSKEVKRWTTDADAHEYTDLPLDYPYRKLMVGCRLDAYSPVTIFDNIKLSEDQDKKVVFNNSFRDLIFSIGRENAYIEESIGVPVHAMTQRKMYCTHTMKSSLMGTEWDGTRHGGELATWDQQGGLFYTLCTTAANYVILCKGYAPHGFLCVPFGLQNEIEDWYNVGGIGSLKLDVTDGEDNGISKIFIQQLRTY